MTSLCRHLSAQEIVNWVMTADGCVHTDDTIKLSPTSCKFVFTPPTPTRQNSFVLSASAVCIGHYTLHLNHRLHHVTIRPLHGPNIHGWAQPSPLIFRPGLPKFIRPGPFRPADVQALMKRK